MTVTSLKEFKESSISFDRPRRVTILGSTGSIGQNTLKVIEGQKGQFEIAALTANSNVKMLSEQAKITGAKLAVIADEKLYNELKDNLFGTDIEVAAGEEAVCEAAGRKSDFVMAAIIGAAGLKPAISAIEQGTTIGLANKECLVCAGEFFNNKLKKSLSNIVPVDSEHNSLFQIFDFDKKETVEKVTITASGGPFFKFSKEEMADVTPEQAVKHPNWSMGAKISVDSATMMNKGLEIIEAYHLFPIEKSQIEVLVHPESVIHSMVSYQDGSVIAGMSNPDMKIPISYALGWPNRLKIASPRLDLVKTGKLSFFAPDTNKFPALNLARKALEKGGTATTILNAANEIAVESFLKAR